MVVKIIVVQLNEIRLLQKTMRKYNMKILAGIKKNDNLQAGPHQKDTV